MKIREIETKTTLVRSRLDGIDYVINPYSGCSFGCLYCYADFMRRFSGHLSDEWGSYVDVKVNASDILRRELRSYSKRRKKGRELYKNGRHSVILISSVTDPYQGVEAKYQITRKCLFELIEADFDGQVDILTKSPLVVRDIDYFTKLAKVRVGLTITTTDNRVAKLLEKNAPLSSVRLDALEKLNERDVDTYVCVNPLLPYFSVDRGNLDNLFAEIKNAGTNKIFVEHLNLTGTKARRLFDGLGDKVSDEIRKEIMVAQEESYKEELNTVVIELLKKHNLRILGGGIMDHANAKVYSIKV